MASFSGKSENGKGIGLGKCPTSRFRGPVVIFRIQNLAYDSSITQRVLRCKLMNLASNRAKERINQIFGTLSNSNWLGGRGVGSRPTYDARESE